MRYPKIDRHSRLAIPPVLALVCGSILLAAACNDTQEPAPVAHESLVLGVERTIGSPGYVISVSTTNDGDVPIDLFRCTCSLLLVRSPDGQVVQLAPSELGCIDVCYTQTMAPAEVVRESLSFNGMIYNGIDPMEAPAGTYVVTAVLTWAGSPSGARHDEVREKTFVWPVP